MSRKIAVDVGDADERYCGTCDLLDWVWKNGIEPPFCPLQIDHLKHGKHLVFRCQACIKAEIKS